MLGGDEFGRTQRGNNNAYCQDNEISWLDWDLDESRRAMLAFTARVIALRNRHPLFRRQKFFRGRDGRDPDVADILWLNPDGGEMTDAEWSQSFARCFGAHLSGRGLAERDVRGQPVTDDDVLLLLNAHLDVIPFRLAAACATAEWTVAIDTGHMEGVPSASMFRAGTEYPLQGRSLALLTCRRS